MVGEVLDGIALRSIVLKAHKPEMIALWAKENKIKGWEHYWRAYHPSEVQKRRQWSIKAYNNKAENGPQSKLNKSVTFKRPSR